MTGKVDVVATLARVDEATAGRSHQDLVWIGTVVPSFPPSHLQTPPDHCCRCSAAARVSHLCSSEPAARVGDGPPRHCIGEEVLDRILVSTATPRCSSLPAAPGSRPSRRLPASQAPTRGPAATRRLAGASRSRARVSRSHLPVFSVEE